MTDQENNAAMATFFLREIYRRANLYSDRLDPKRKRNYKSDPLLRGMDAIAAQAKLALHAAGLSLEEPEPE